MLKRILYEKALSLSTDLGDIVYLTKGIEKAKAEPA